MKNCKSVNYILGINEATATTGKAGAQFSVLGVEVEGPRAGAGASNALKQLQFGAFADASLARAELQVGPVGARIEPNVNTAIGVRNGGFQLKLLGFGISSKGLFSGSGFHTPLGSVGYGNF